MSLFKTEFPDYDDTLYCPAGFEDVSYHNDTMPHVRKEMKLGDKDVEINIWQDYNDVNKREYDNTKRFIFSIVVDGEIAEEYSTDDLNDIKRYVSDLETLINSALNNMNENNAVALVTSKILEGADIRKTVLEYVPDITQRYPDGMSSSSGSEDSALSGSEDSDFEPVSVKDIIKSIKSDVAEGDFYNHINLWKNNKKIADLHSVSELEKFKNNFVHNWRWFDATIDVYLV